MRRREFVAATAGALSIRPLGLRAQQNRPVIGFLGTNAPELTAGRSEAFQKRTGCCGRRISCLRDRGGGLDVRNGSRSGR